MFNCNIKLSDIFVLSGYFVVFVMQKLGQNNPISTVPGKRQKMIDGCISRNEEGYTKTEEFCITWATCGLPYSLVDNQRFRKTTLKKYTMKANEQFEEWVVY